MTQDVGGLNIVTDFVVDDRGRTIESLGPVHNVDGNDIRTAAWTVYTDEHETRTARGYVNVSNGVRTLVNPIQISRRSLDETTTDQVTAVIGSGTDVENVFYQKPTLDNLGRTTKSQSFRVESGQDVLIAQSESFYDPRGQMYLSKTYGVNDNGVLGNAF